MRLDNHRPPTRFLREAVRALAIVPIAVLVASFAEWNRGDWTATAVAADDALDDYKLAVGLYNKSRWKLAAESFQAFIKKNPQHRNAENARFYLGLTLVNLEDYKQSRDVLRSFLKDFPRSDHATPAVFWMGQCSYLLDDLPAAEAELAAFVRKSPEDPLRERALPWLGEVEFRQNKLEPAVQHLQQAIKAFPQGSLIEDAKFFLARSFEAQKKYPEAVALYQELAGNRAGTRAAEAQLNLGARAFDDGNFPVAAQAYQKLEQQFPESPLVPLARLNQGFALYQAGSFPQAIAQFDKAGQEAKFAPEAALWKGLSLKSLANYPQAIAALKAAYEQHRDHAAAERLLFQWADCEQRQGNPDKARELFVEVANRWPKGSLADESLHAASAAALHAGKLPETEALLARFDKEFPGNKLRFRQEILKGRLLLAKNDPGGAAKHFETVIAGSDIDSTKSQGRFHLAAALQKLNQHARVIEVTEPLAAQVEKDKSLGEFLGVYVLRGASSLALGKSTPAEKMAEKVAHLGAAATSAQKYIAQSPQGELAAQAWVVTTLAQAHAGNKPAAQSDLASFKKQFPQSPEIERTLFEVGEIAFATADWEWAETLFAELATKPKESKFHSRALSELGWSQFKRKKFPDAAASFARLIAEHPTDEIVPEAAFMEASSLQDSGKLPEAQAKFAAAFKQHGTSEQAFLSGLQSARLLARLKRPADADLAYDELLKRFSTESLKRFSKPVDAASVLNEWAATNYDAENYTRADEIFRRLVQEHPASPLAGTARLSLAESDLVNGRIDAARTQFAALVASPQSDETVQQRALYQIVLIELEQKRWDELRKACREALLKFPAGTYRWETEFRWAEADFQSGAYKESQERLLKLKAEALKPKAEKDHEAVARARWFPQVWVLLAETQFRLKQHADVAATAAEARTWDAKSPLLYQVDEVLGRSLKALAKFAEARAAFERVIKDPSGQLTETAAKSQFHIAETFLLEKDYQRALLEYLKVDIRYKFPAWQAPSLLQAGACHEALNEWKEAVKTYENLLRDYPNSEYAPKARERLEVARKKAAG